MLENQTNQPPAHKESHGVFYYLAPVVMSLASLAGYDPAPVNTSPAHLVRIEEHTVGESFTNMQGNIIEVPCPETIVDLYKQQSYQEIIDGVKKVKFFFDDHAKVERLHDMINKAADPDELHAIVQKAFKERGVGLFFYDTTPALQTNPPSESKEPPLDLVGEKTALHSLIRTYETMPAALTTPTKQIYLENGLSQTRDNTETRLNALAIFNTNQAEDKILYDVNLFVDFGSGPDARKTVAHEQFHQLDRTNCEALRPKLPHLSRYNDLFNASVPDDILDGRGSKSALEDSAYAAENLFGTFSKQMYESSSPIAQEKMQVVANRLEAFAPGTQAITRFYNLYPQPSLAYMSPQEILAGNYAPFDYLAGIKPSGEYTQSRQLQFALPDGTVQNITAFETSDSAKLKLMLGIDDLGIPSDKLDDVIVQLMNTNNERPYSSVTYMPERGQASIATIEIILHN